MSGEQLIVDAQKLVNRLKDLDSLCSSILVEAEANSFIAESLKRFQDDMNLFNGLSNQKINSEIVETIQRQNTRRSEIIKENIELKMSIEDYENAMTFIMSKFREHTSSKTLKANSCFQDGYKDTLQRIINNQKEKINEMASVMKFAATIDEVSRNDEQAEKNLQLQEENEIARKILCISKFSNETIPLPDLKHTTSFEKANQTEDLTEDDDTPDESNDLNETLKYIEDDSTSGVVPTASSTTLLSFTVTDSNYFSSSLCENSEHYLPNSARYRGNKIVLSPEMPPSDRPCLFLSAPTESEV